MAMGFERPQSVYNFFHVKWFMIQRNICLIKDLLIACFVADKNCDSLKFYRISVVYMHQRTQRLLLHDHRPISEWSLACLCWINKILVPECPNEAVSAKAMATYCLNSIFHNKKTYRAKLFGRRLINEHKIVPSKLEFMFRRWIFFWIHRWS